MKTGDTVKHVPSGESWVLAYVDGDYLAPCGWPPGEARVSDCELVEECSEEESLKLLRHLAGWTESGDQEVRNDRRGRVARRILEQRGQQPKGDPS